MDKVVITLEITMEVGDPIRPILEAIEIAGGKYILKNLVNVIDTQDRPLSQPTRLDTIRNLVQDR